MQAIGHNFFHGFHSQSARPSLGVASPRVASEAKLLPSTSSLLNVRDEYIPSANVSSVSFKMQKRVPLSTARLADTDDQQFSLLNLTEAGRVAFYKMFVEVSEEMGIVHCGSYSIGSSINAEGIFTLSLHLPSIVHRSGLLLTKVDQDVMNEFRATVEARLNDASSPFRKNPHYLEKNTPPSPDSSNSATSVPSYKPVSVKLPSLFGDFFKMNKMSSPLSDLTKDLNRLLLEGIITQALNASGVELREGDVLSMTLNGKGEIFVNATGSSIGGATGDEIAELCGMLSGKLNGTETAEGESLGTALLKQFAEDLGFDFDKVKGDENFSIAFSFKYNSKTGRNELSGAKLDRVNLQMLDALSIQQANRLDNTDQHAPVSPIFSTAPGDVDSLAYFLDIDMTNVNDVP
jgi:hypothetical protein